MILSIKVFEQFCLLGNIYNIPVCLWLLDTYPYNPPICFVKPTSAMMIKTGKHIDANGKIYLPYLHEWKHVSNSVVSSILALAILYLCFSACEFFCDAHCITLHLLLNQCLCT